MGRGLLHQWRAVTSPPRRKGSPACNKGYATEGSRALISMGCTDLGVERVFAHAATVNTASWRVLEKCGMPLVRTTPYE
jgi:RimJ/RimL family protein N-acetyltransferase